MIAALLVLASAGLAVHALLTVRKNWLNLAETERQLARTWHALGDHDEAEKHEERAELYEQRAWPFKPAPEHEEQL
jgi:hypothetical protein